MDDFSATLALAKKGDRDAQARIYARYVPLVAARVRSRGRRAVRRRFDTDDLVQSVFAEVLRDLPRFDDRGEDAFRHWMYLKAESKVREKLRRLLRPGGGRREATLLSVDESRAASRSAGPATAAGQVETRDVVRALVDGLPHGQRAVLLLRTEQGLDFDTVARRLGLAGADAARMRFVRALAALEARWTRRSK